MTDEQRQRIHEIQLSLMDLRSEIEDEYEHKREQLGSQDFDLDALENLVADGTALSAAIVLLELSSPG